MYQERRRGEKMIVLLLFLASLASAELSVLPAQIGASDVRPAEHSYTVTVYIGSPPEQMQLEVRFDVAGLWIYRNQGIHSASHVKAIDGRESDIMYFGGTRQRYHATCGSVPHTLKSPLLCGKCDGVLGLRADSELWMWWPSAAFTPASITLGHAAPAFKDNDDETLWTIPCENSVDEWALCTTRVMWRNRLYRAEIAPHYSYISMPRHVRDAYLDDKNIYDDKLSWPDFELRFFDAKRGDSDEKLFVEFSRNDLSGQHGVEARELLIDVVTHRNDTFIIGSALLRKMLLYRTTNRGILIAHAHHVYTHMPIVNSILFLAVMWFSIRWKMTDIGKHYARAHERSTRTRTVDIVYQVAGWAVAITSLLLRSTYVVLKDLVWLHILMAIVIGLGIFIEVGARAFLFQAQRQGKLLKPSNMAFLLVILESVWHESVLMVTLWLLVVPLRREDLAGPVTAIVSAVGVYSVLVHGFIYVVFLYSCMTLPRKPKVLVTITSAAVFFSILGLEALFVTIFLPYSIIPLLKRISAIYAELAFPTAMTALLLIGMAALVMSDNYISRAMQISVHQRIKTKADKQEREKRRAEDEGVKVIQGKMHLAPIVQSLVTKRR